MKLRSVTHLLYANPVDMGGMPVRQPFPTIHVEQIDPFLLLHHADTKVPRHLKPAHTGVGPHPTAGLRRSPLSSKVVCIIATAAATTAWSMRPARNG